jgi:hypothetical protein
MCACRSPKQDGQGRGVSPVAPPAATRASSRRPQPAWHPPPSNAASQQRRIPSSSPLQATGPSPVRLALKQPHSRPVVVIVGEDAPGWALGAGR